MKGLSNSDVQLASALKDIQRAWEMTAATWRDQARVDFENTYIQEMRPGIKGSIGAINEINRILHQAIQDCS